MAKPMAAPACIPLPAWPRLLLALCLVSASGSWADVTVYRCKLGEPARVVQEPVQPPSEGQIAASRQWHEVMVKAVARAIDAQVPLDAAADMFLTVVRTGPLLTSQGTTVVDPFAEARGRRFLDAMQRLHGETPLALVRDLLSDRAVVTELRADTSGSARRGAHYVYASRLAGAAAPTALGALLPALLPARDDLSERDLVLRCMAQIDEGRITSDVADLLARTFMWDLRLFLLACPTDEALQAALTQEDGALAQEFRDEACRMHLRYFLFGGRERKETAELWDSFDAEAFIARRPDLEWIGYAAALAYEVREGVLWSVEGPSELSLMPSGRTAPVTFTIRPAVVTTSASLAADGVQLPDGATWVRQPFHSPCATCFTGSGDKSALSCTMTFSRVGVSPVAFGSSLCGLQLPDISHPVRVIATPRAQDPDGKTPGGDTQQVFVALPGGPPGYAPLYGDVTPDPFSSPQRVLVGMRKFAPYADGQHGMETSIQYEVRTGPEGSLPGEVAFCDRNPARGGIPREEVLQEAVEAITRVVGREWSLAPTRARVPGRECWVGLGGRGEDGKLYYVLCRGRLQYFKRNEAYLYHTYWDPLIGEHPVYDASQLEPDVRAVAKAVLAQLRALRAEEMPLPVAGIAATPGQVNAFLQEAQSILDVDASLLSRLDMTSAAWRQQRLDGPAAARTIADDIVSAYDTLVTRAGALQAPDQTLGAILEDLKAVLAIGVAASRLIERGVRNADEEKTNRGIALLHSYDDQRRDLRMRATALRLRDM